VTASITSINPHIAIGMPARDTVSTEFAECLWALGRSFQGKLGLIKGGSGSVVFARNIIVDQIQSMKNPDGTRLFDYVMFLDTDLVIPRNVIERLLAHKKHIVCATYVRRGPPFDNLGHPVLESDRTAKTGLIQMSHVPTGCLLIKMDVFDRLVRPYFRFETDEVNGILRGEDYVFSEAVTKLGYSIWCDMDLSRELGHVYQYVLRTNDPQVQSVAEGYRQLMNEQLPNQQIPSAANG
jgi:hypothetical protein